MADARITLSATDGTKTAFQSVKASLTGLKDQASGLKGTLSALAAAAGVGALSGYIKEAIDAGDEVNKLSQKMGVQAREVAGLQLAYKQAGLDGELMEKSVAKLTKSVADNNIALRALGIKTREAGGGFRETLDVFYDVADVFAKMPEGMQRSALASEIFGEKLGSKMIPLLAGGSQGLRDMAEMAERLGLVIDEKTAKQSEEFNDTLELIHESSKGVWRQVSAQLLPTMQGLAAEFLATKTQGEGTSRMAEGIVAVFRVLYSTGAAVFGVLQGLGQGIAGLVAAAVQVGQGNFSGALEALKAARSDMAGTFTATSERIKAAWSGEGNAAVASAAKALGAGRDLMDEQRKKDEALKKSAEAAKKLREEFEKLRDKIGGKDLGVDPDFIANLKLLASEGKKAGLAEAEILRLQEKYIAQQPYMTAQVKALAEAREEEAKLRAESVATAFKEIDSLEAEVKKEREQYAALGLTTKQLAELEAGKLDAAAAAKVKMAAEEEERDGDLTLAAAYREQAARLHELADAKRSTAAKAADIEENRRVWEAIDQTAHDVFTNIFEGGSNVFKKLGQTLKASLLDLLYQMTVRPFIINLVANVMGNGFGGGIANAAGSGIGNMLGGTLMSGAARMFGIGGGAGMSFGNMAGTTFANMTGTGIDGLLATNGAYGTASGGAGAGAMGSLGATGIGAAIAAGMAINNNLWNAGYRVNDWGQAAQTMVSPVGSGSGLIDMALQKLGLSSQMASMLSGSALSVAALSLLGVQKPGGPKTDSGYGALDVGRGDSAYATQIAQGIQASYAAIASTLGVVDTTIQNLGVWVAQDPRGTAMTQLQIQGGSFQRATDQASLENVGRSDADLQAAVAQAGTQMVVKLLQDSAQGAVGDYLRSINITSASLDDLQHALAVAQNVGTFDKAMQALGPTFSGLQGMSVEAKDALVTASGGVAALVGNLGALFSESEKQQMAWDALTQSFADVGVQVPASVADYRTAIVAAMQDESDAGRRATSVLLQNVQAFTQLSPVMQDAAQQVGTLDDAISALRNPVRSIDDIAQSIVGLQDQGQQLLVDLMRAQGDAGAGGAQRFLDTRGMTDEEVALYDLIKARQNEIAALQEQQAHEQQLASARTQLGSQILQLEGNTAALRERELAGLDETLRPLQERIYELQDEAAATAAANQLAERRRSFEQQIAQLSGDTATVRAMELAALDESLRPLQQRVYDLQDEAMATQAALRIANERYGLETHLLQLQGDTAALRERELAALDPTNRALQQQIYDLEDLQAHERDLAEQRRQQADAARQLKDAWQSTTITLFDEVRRIRGLMGGTGAAGYASLQAQFSAATAAARGGDKNAAALLPQLSQQLLAAAQDRAGSTLELRRIQGLTASSLETTGLYLSGRYGLQTPADMSSGGAMVAALLSIDRRLASVEKSTERTATAGEATQTNTSDTASNTGHIRRAGMALRVNADGEAIGPSGVVVTVRTA